MIRELEQLADEVAKQFVLGRAAQAALAPQDANLANPDSLLTEALKRCAAARSLIPEEQAKVRVLIDEAKSDSERRFREYQHDLIAWQLTRAADISERRIAYFENLTDTEAELKKCADGVAGTLHWFEYYAWGYDPRPDAPLQVMPFAFDRDSTGSEFAFQSNYVRWLERTVFDLRTSGLVEKSRDMGATVTAINWTLKQWLFRDNFSALLLSTDEDLVDSKKDKDTLFEKARFGIRLLPHWMLPAGFDLVRDMTHMSITNPATGADITGEAPTENVGRQRRRTFVLMDEFATWRFGGYPQYDSLSQTVRSMLILATPKGKFNKYSELRHSGNANVFEMDWREHPWKDDRWYGSLTFGYGGPPMTAESIAQEIDRNYEASQPGKVFKDWHAREPYVLITWSELVAYYARFNLGRHFVDEETGAYRVPSDWNWGRMQDYGQTKAHGWVVTHGARPRENYPLSDSFFVFGSFEAPVGAAVGEVQPLISAQEMRLGLYGTPELSQMSHEQCGIGGVAETFMEEHGEYWEAWSTDYSVGIPQIQEWLMLVDQHLENPFRPSLPGRTRLYFVCADEIRLAYNPRTKEHFVTPSKSDLSFKLARAEMPSYHYPPEEMGKPLALMRPEKKKGMDNFIDTLRGFATRWGPSVAPMTKQEKRISKLPDELKPAEVMAKIGRPEFVELVAAQSHALHQLRRAEERETEAQVKKLGRFLGRPVTHRRYKGK